MVRLTRKDIDGNCLQPLYARDGIKGYVSTKMVLERLAEYEDTGLTPEEVSNLNKLKTELLRKLCKSELKISSLKEKYKQLLNDAEILDDALREYQDV